MLKEVMHSQLLIVGRGRFHSEGEFFFVDSVDKVIDISADYNDGK